jgi:hypothetical protein
MLLNDLISDLIARPPAVWRNRIFYFSHSQHRVRLLFVALPQTYAKQ